MSANPVISPGTTAAKPQNLKLIALDIGKLSLAVRIEQVAKVVNLPTVHGSGTKPVGLSQVDGQDITVLDLHRRLFQIAAAPTPSRYLVLIKNQRGEVLGIPVLETPLLLDVSAHLIRSLPESYRRSDTLEIASHIAVVPVAEDQTRTLFLLDVDRLTR